MEETIYVEDYRYLGAKAREWRAARRWKEIVAFADRMLVYSVCTLVLVCIAATLIADAAIAAHERTFCFAIAECPKI